jgi:dsRNA-specific ribonuclease
MRPQSAYVDLGQSGTPPNAEFTVGVTVDEKQFLGKGRSKKSARRNAAAEACKQIWGVEFCEAVMNS